jgi:hypothetical protein
MTKLSSYMHLLPEYVSKKSLLTTIGKRTKVRMILTSIFLRRSISQIIIIQKKLNT